MHRLKEPMAFHKNCKCVRHQGNSASFDLGYSMEHRELVEDAGKWNCSDDDPKSNLSRHRSKCASSTGMHQSAEPIKDSFYCWSTPLLTLCLAVRAWQRHCLPAIDHLTELKDVVLYLMTASLKVTLRMRNLF